MEIKKWTFGYTYIPCMQIEQYSKFEGLFICLWVSLIKCVPHFKGKVIVDKQPESLTKEILYNEGTSKAQTLKCFY